MRILEFCLSYGYGGLELYAINTAKFLNDSNYDYQFIAKKNTFIDNKLKDLKIAPNYLDVKISSFPIISAIKLAKYLEKNKIDIIHIHWRYDFLLVVLAKVFIKRKIKIVYTRHMALTRYKHDFYHRFLYENVDAFLVISKALYADAIKYLPIKNEHIHLLHHGVPAAEKNTINCESYISESGMDINKFRLAIFGRIEKGKGQHLVVKAANNLIKQGKELEVGIIGHVMDKAYFSALKDDIKKNGIENNVFYLGFHNQPISIMPCFDAVVLATKCETFGLVLPEAMRAGVTVIGSNCGGVPDIIQHEKTGLLFESENVIDLTAQLSKIIDDKEFCDKLAFEGQKDADERFSEEAHFEKLIELFETA